MSAEPSPPTLRELFERHDQRRVLKLDTYLDDYEDHLGHLRDGRPVRVRPPATGRLCPPTAGRAHRPSATPNMYLLFVRGSVGGPAGINE